MISAVFTVDDFLIMLTPDFSDLTNILLILKSCKSWFWQRAEWNDL